MNSTGPSILRAGTGISSRSMSKKASDHKIRSPWCLMDRRARHVAFRRIRRCFCTYAALLSVQTCQEARERCSHRNATACESPDRDVDGRTCIAVAVKNQTGIPSDTALRTD